MEQNFPLSKAAETALKMLEHQGYEAYVVGGCVRDFCMNTPPHDYDITSAASPGEVKRIFQSFHVIPTGEKHGTITVMMDGEPLEITTFRKDGDYLDGRHPENVQFTTAIEEDLKRRDFTVNAMAYSPTRGMKDPFHGREDLQNGILRCVGDAPTRFTEDALRLLRALRFAARLEFSVETQTAAALHDLAPAIEKVSRERVFSEMNGLLLAKGLKTIMLQFHDVVCAAVPEIGSIPKADYLGALNTVEQLPPDITLRWAALLAPLGDDAALALRHLKAPNQLTQDVSALIACRDTEVMPDTVKHFMCRIGPAMTEKLCALRHAQGLLPDTALPLAKMQHILDTGECYKLSMLAVTGNDLKEIGIAGKQIGLTLQKLLDEVLCGNLPNEKETLLRAIRTF